MVQTQGVTGADAIVADGIVKHFGDVHALNGVSFRVPSGKVLGVLGPNGAGKTTSVRVLTTLLRPDSGRAEVLGIDVVKDPQRVRASIGLAGQYAAVDENLTAAENLKMVGKLTHLPPADIRARSAELLEGFNLVHAADRVVRTFSGGMRRRLDLAAALVHRPPVLFLDEPTTGLDPQGRLDLWTVIETLTASGVTVLLTSQYLEEVDRLADNIIVIDHGRVIAEGTAAALKARLGATVIDVAMRDPDDARRAGTDLGPIGGVSVDGKVVHVNVTDGNGPAAMLEIVRMLDGTGLQPASMLLREPTLDDVFLELTGHVAEEVVDDVDDVAPEGRGRRGKQKSNTLESAS
ncbi:MAG: ATP-binding cassette domain-containing protein [Acidimicrobiia bacterium]